MACQMELRQMWELDPVTCWALATPVGRGWFYSPVRVLTLGS